jgi:A/G-specific adenine glycosylase
MLQQTQVARVIPAYRAFLARFPTLGALASASLGDVLREWSGLGYNRRARDLHRVARERPDALPADVAALDALPGIGAYTAGAVACFAFGLRAAFADTNVRRVLGRIVLGRVATEREAVLIDEELMPRDAAPWHHALMDLGATICTARSPRCDECPVSAACRGRGRATERVRRAQPTFATSDRRVRGWIISLLRERDMTVTSLNEAIADPRVPRLVAALGDEGLVELRGAKVTLPA